MRLAQSLFSNGKGLLVEGECLLRPVPQFMQAREIMKSFSRFRMPGSSLLLSNGVSAPVEQFRLLILALFSIEIGQPVERKGDLGMLAAQHLFTKRQGALVEGLGLLVLGSLEQIVCRLRQ